MGRKTLAPMALFVLLTFTCARGQQSGKSVALSPSPAWNDNSLITVQKTGGDSTRPGDVKIEFYGHDAFKITSPVGLTVLTDPLRNESTGLYPKWFLTEFPAIRVDIVLSTHAHFDHDAVERPKAEAQKVYETYREAGGNFIDTANFYTGGTSEKFLGEFIKGHRDSVVLATKTPTPRPAMIPMRRAITARA
jgi:hypothetical protein